MENTVEKPQSGTSFKIMSFMFKLRDFIRPRKNVLKEVGLKPGFQVLDFGCGPGGYILPLEKFIGESGRIFALDVNPRALESVKNLALKKKLANVETILSSGATGLPDSSVDAVLLYDVLHHLGRSNEILAEFHRVLKPGGVLSVTDHHMKEEGIISKTTGTGLFRLLMKGKKVYNFSKV